MDSASATRRMADETGRRFVPRMRRLMSFTAIGKGGDQAASGFSRPDFTGVWKQVRHENANAYFTAMGYSFALRSIVVRFIGDSTEIVSHKGERVHLNSINRRGEWKRTYVDNQEIPLTMADGQAVTSTSWWERDETLGVDVHKTRLVGAKEGTLETWRWMDPADSDSGQGRMVVKSIVYPQGGEAEPAHMLWHFEPAREEKHEIQSHLLLRSFEDLYVKPSTRSGAETLPRPGEDRGEDPQDPPAASPVARKPAPHLAASRVSSWLERFSKNLSESFATTDRLVMDHSFLNRGQPVAIKSQPLRCSALKIPSIGPLPLSERSQWEGDHLLSSRMDSFARIFCSCKGPCSCTSPS